MIADTKTSPQATDRAPRDDEIDFFGLTNVGKVRKNNQDNFLICSMRRKMEVHLSSLPSLDRLPMGAERIALLAMVADGVGGGPMGEEASRFAVEAVTQYVTRSIRLCTADSAGSSDAFAHALEGRGAGVPRWHPPAVGRSAGTRRHGDDADHVDRHVAAIVPAPCR